MVEKPFVILLHRKVVCFQCCSSRV